MPAKLLNDDSFLNMLHGHVNAWIKAIQGVTRLTREVASGTASQEVNFWLSLERALEAQPEVDLLRGHRNAAAL
jgi:hypothetical protein